MDATTKRRKQEELSTWQRNLATLQAQAANHGMTPPIDLVNEIETAQRNIKRVQQDSAYRHRLHRHGALLQQIITAARAK